MGRSKQVDARMAAEPEEAPEIPPFWKLSAQFFRYPLHWEPLLYMVFLSLAVAGGVVLSMPLLSVVIVLGAWLAFIRYAYKTLDQTSQGCLTPEQHSVSDDPARKNLPYKQFFIFVVLGVVIGFAQRAGGLVFGAAVIFSILATPASVMILTITRSFLAALNPLGSISMMRVIGTPYLALCGFLFLLSASQSALMGFLLPRLPGWLIVPSANFVSMYFTLIMFNMMGYVVYQHHHLLGVPVREANTGGKKGEKNGGRDEVGATIGRLVGAGAIEQALDLAYEAQRVAPDDVLAHERYHKLLALAGKEDRLLAHSQRYLAALLQRGKGDEALLLFREMRTRQADFTPEQPGALLRLAEAARRRREYKEALEFLKGFDKRFPKHADIPAVYLFAAQVLAENLRQDAQARKLLEVLLARYPEHPVRPQASQLLAVLDRLAGASAKC